MHTAEVDCRCLPQNIMAFYMLQERPAAHRGYLGRSRHIPVEELFATAQSKGKRLILCGERDGSQKQHCRSTMLIYDPCGPPAMTYFRANRTC